MTRHRWLLIVAIAAALVGMHHLVAEHRGHAGPSAHGPMTLAAGAGSVLISPTPTEHPPAGPLAVNPVKASVALTAVSASHPCCGDSRNMVEQGCLAVLTTITAVTAVLIVVTAWRRPAGPGHLRAGSAPVRCGHSPPVLFDVSSSTF